MGYLLLWVENLAVALLFTATLFACIGRLQRRRMMLILAPAVAILPLLVYVPATLAAYVMEYQKLVTLGLFRPFLLLTICYLAGALWMRIRGLRAGKVDSFPTPAAHWRRGRLAAAWLVVTALHAMTFWNLDVAVRQELSAVRVEAGALAMSVAPQRLPDQQNAAPVYQQVFDAWENDRDWPSIWDCAVDALDDGRYLPRPENNDRSGSSLEERVFDYADPELGEFLRQRAGQLAVIRKAAALPGCYFDRDYGRPGYDMLLPELQHLRQATRLLAVDARYQAATGNLRTAIEDLNAVFAIAKHAGAEPILISGLVCIAAESTAIEGLAQTLILRAALEEDLAALRIDPFVSYQQMFQRSFRMEEAFGLWTFSTLADERGLEQVLSISNSGSAAAPSAAPSATPSVGALYRVLLLRGDMDSYRQLMRKLQAELTHPYHVHSKQTRSVEEELQRAGAGLLTKMIVPALSTISERAAAADATRRAALAGVAAYRYAARHGQLPERLQELSPELLDIVPYDPFDGQPLRWKRTDQGYVAYSIGPDLKDDDGAPFERQSRKGDICFTVVAHARP